MLTSHSPLRDSTGEPLVTIAIPTFNRAEWLKKCIIAALLQTYQHVEIVVSDNASTDETAEILRQFDNPKLRVLKQQTNIGMLPNWNACLAAAKGEYIVFCSDDDLLEPQMLQRCVGVIAQSPQIPIVLNLCDTYYPSKGYLHRAKASTKVATGVCEGSDLLIEYLRRKIDVVICSMIIGTKALRDIGGIPVDFPAWGADVAAWAPILMHSRAGFINESGATYCDHGASDHSRLTLDELLYGEREVANYIINTAGNIIDNLNVRRRVQLEARLYLAQRIVFCLAQHRKRGSKLSEILPWIWSRRYEIKYIGLRNPLNFLKPIALILFPKLMADQIRLLKQSYLRMFMPSVNNPTELCSKRQINHRV